MASVALLSEAKLKEWMTRLGPKLITLAAGICRDRHRAEEIVQEAFIKLWKQPPDAGEVAFSSWLRRVVTNLSINHVKRNRRAGALPDYSSDAALHTVHREYEQVDDQDDIARIRAAMGRLEESKRAILLLRAHEQMSYEEIAEHLGVPVGTVMSRLNRARTSLKEEMDARAGGAGGADEASRSPVVYRFKQA